MGLPMERPPLAPAVETLPDLSRTIGSVAVDVAGLPDRWTTRSTTSSEPAQAFLYRSQNRVSPARRP